MRRSHVWAGLFGSILLAGGPALAEDFHGFDPANFDGAMLSADQLKAMVGTRRREEAAAQRQDIRPRLRQPAARHRLLRLRSRTASRPMPRRPASTCWSPTTGSTAPTALANAQSFLQRNVDYVIEFQTDANFGATIMRRCNDAGTKVTAIDIPMPGATFFGANNPRSGFMGGSYLGQAAIAKFGADKVEAGLFRGRRAAAVGRHPGDAHRRPGGRLPGAVPPASRPTTSSRIDTKNTLEESFAQMSNVSAAFPAGVPIMVTAINDQAAHRHAARRQAGRPRGGLRRGRHRRRRDPDAGERAGLRRLGRLFPGALRQLPRSRSR